MGDGAHTPLLRLKALLLSLIPLSCVPRAFPQGLMSLLDEDAFGDADAFMQRYGADTPSLEQIRALQAALAPLLLRRMKEDVENLPEKEEVVIWVELTAEQRRYYRALYSQQIGALLGGGSSKNLPGMRNLAMELRKLCCHPVSVRGGGGGGWTQGGKGVMMIMMLGGRVGSC